MDVETEALICSTCSRSHSWLVTEPGMAAFLIPPCPPPHLFHNKSLALQSCTLEKAGLKWEDLYKPAELLFLLSHWFFKTETLFSCLWATFLG